MLKKILEQTINFIGLILDDILLIAGVVFLYLGVTAIHPPSGNIVLGICLITIAALIARNKKHGKQ